MYQSELLLTVVGGTLPPTVTVRLWDVSDSINPNTEKIETETFEAGPHLTLSTNVASEPGNPITRRLPVSLNVAFPPPTSTGALSVHTLDNTTPVDLFRSGRFSRMTASPTEPFEVVMFDPVLIDRAELLEGLPQTPIEFDEQVVKLPGISVTVFATVTSLSVALQQDQTIAISCEGTMRPGRAAALVNFSFAAKLAIGGSGDLLDPADVLAVGIVRESEKLSFTSHGSVASDVEAALLNVLSGWLAGEVAPKIRARIDAAVNAQALQKTADVVSGGSSVPAALPAGIVLSVREVTIHAPGGPVEGIGVFAALGAFGGVLSKFPKPSSGGGGSSNCALSSIAALRAAAADLAPLRALRDRMLAGDAREQALVAAYRRHSPEAWRLLREDPRGLALAGRLLDDALAGRLDLATALRARLLARRLARRSSPQLRLALRDALASPPPALALGRPALIGLALGRPARLLP